MIVVCCLPCMLSMKSYKSDAGMWAQAKAGLADLAARVPIPHGTEGLVESCWLLLTSVVAVPLVCLVPGGSAVLGFLVGSQPLRFCTSRLRPKVLSPVSVLSCLLPLQRLSFMSTWCLGGVVVACICQ